LAIPKGLKKKKKKKKRRRRKRDPAKGTFNVHLHRGRPVGQAQEVDVAPVAHEPGAVDVLVPVANADRVEGGLALDHVRHDGLGVAVAGEHAAVGVLRQELNLKIPPT